LIDSCLTDTIVLELTMKSILGQSKRHLKWAAGWKVRLPAILLVVLLSSLLFATPAAAAPGIVPSTLPSAQVSASYSAVLIPFGGTPPYTNWTVSSGVLPPGLTLGATTGVISGTPTIAGTYTFFVTVTDTIPQISAPQGFSITVAATPITFTTTTLLKAKEGVSYLAYIIVAGGKTPYTFSLTSGVLPSGLTLDPVNGIISGTPAAGSAGSYTITIGVTDSSTPPLSASHSYSLVVGAGYFESVIRVSVSLSAGETNVYYRADGVVDKVIMGALEGGEELTWSFDVDDKMEITVDATVLSPTRSDVRFTADDAAIVVDEDNPDATFSYTTEYYIDLKTDPAQIATLTGAGWFEVDDFIEATAPVLIEESTDTQYRFDYWLLPDGDEDVNEDLNWKVTAPGKATATYETYYLLTVASAQGEVNGGGWYKAGTAADWSINPPEAPMSGILGFFRGKLKPDNATGTEVMNAPRTITVTWNPDYTWPAVFISLLVLFLIGGALGLYYLLHPPRPKPVMPAAEPAPPTIVLIDGRLGPGTTKEQLVDQFKQLLQKYEDEVGSTSKGEGFPEAKLIAAAPGVAPAKEEAVCGHTSKKLLRTVVGKWHKTEEEVVPPDEKTSTKGVSIKTIWARDIYKEWEVSVCSLPQGHSGDHHGTTTKGYTLEDTVTEELSYSAKQKTTPPKSHFTDELPVVAVAPHQILPSDQDTPDDEAITPDEDVTDGEVITPDEEIIPPDQAEED
jgi:hypothetical protein